MTPETPSAAPVATPPGHRGGLVLLLLVIAGLAALFVLGYLPRWQQSQVLAATAEAGNTRLRVRTAHPRPAPPTIDLHLSGSVEALRETTIYARSNGYVRAWNGDLGDHVTEGQVLVDLDAPEMAHVLAEGEATLAKARADLEQVKANLALAHLQLQRAKTLGPTVTSQQDIDVRQATNDAEEANLVAAEATVKADEANLRRLQQLKAFSKVLAPFAGTVSYRGIEVGDLVTAGSGNTAKVLYRLIQSEQVRVLLDVPQAAATAIREGLRAAVHPRSGVTIDGAVAHLARALDPASRTMRTEVLAPNGDGQLLPGMYVQVDLQVPNPQPLVLVNPNTLLMGAKGPQVAVIDGEGRARLRSIRIELDTGSEIGVATGLSAQDQVMLNPPATLEDGTLVEVLPAEPAPNKAH